MTSPLLRRLRQIWAILGSLAFVGFILWCLIAYRASPTAKAALASDSLVSVTFAPGRWAFAPVLPRQPRISLVFLSGALVDPVAYAPLLHAVAAHGYPAFLLALPWRGAFGLADGADFLDQVRSVTDTIPGAWVLAGHSRGAKIAALVARDPPPRMTGLLLIGSTHPRDFTLADSRLAVTKIYGTADGVAPAGDVLANAALLPPSTRWIPIQGGNHNQFGHYGFQPGDNRAFISRDNQQAATLAGILAALTAAEPRPPAGD